VHIVQQPARSVPAEIEVDLLRIAKVEEFGDHSFAVWALIRTGDGETCDHPVLSVDPVKEVHTAHFTLRLSPIVT
jgi:hypothetical protein